MAQITVEFKDINGHTIEHVKIITEEQAQQVQQLLHKFPGFGMVRTLNTGKTLYQAKNENLICTDDSERTKEDDCMDNCETFY